MSLRSGGKELSKVRMESSETYSIHGLNERRGRGGNWGLNQQCTQGECE